MVQVHLGPPLPTTPPGFDSELRAWRRVRCAACHRCRDRAVIARLDLRARRYYCPSGEAALVEVHCRRAYPVGPVALPVVLPPS